MPHQGPGFKWMTLPEMARYTKQYRAQGRPFVVGAGQIETAPITLPYKDPRAAQLRADEHMRKKIAACSPEEVPPPQPKPLAFDTDRAWDALVLAARSSRYGT